MEESNIKKLSISGLLCALAVVGSLFSFPVLGSKCAPIQHMINILCAVILGPFYGVTVAFSASFIRNLLGIGSPMAFPGSMFGALLCGIVYHKSKKIFPTLLAEIAGTAILGGLFAYPIAIFIMGKSMKDIVFYAYIIPFFISTFVGSIIAGILLYSIMKTNILTQFKIENSKGKGKNMLKEILENVRSKSPLIHNITNYVTVNDCANILLACGASPIMADDIEEVEEITEICSGLNINIGTLNKRTIPSMLAAGKKSNELNHPIVFDPVGAGASKLRTDTAKMLLNDIKFSVIRGNLSEIKSLALGNENIGGVNSVDSINKENLDSIVDFAKDFAAKTSSIIAITSEIDIVADSKTAYCIYNGDKMMSKITGSGCQLSAMMAAYISANPTDILKAALACVCAMGICGETAKSRMGKLDGNSNYRSYLIDAVYNLTPEKLEDGARYEIR